MTDICKKFLFFFFCKQFDSSIIKSTTAGVFRTKFVVDNFSILFCFEIVLTDSGTWNLFTITSVSAKRIHRCLAIKSKSIGKFTKTKQKRWIYFRSWNLVCSFIWVSLSGAGNFSKFAWSFVVFLSHCYFCT